MLIHRVIICKSPFFSNWIVMSKRFVLWWVSASGPHHVWMRWISLIDSLYNTTLCYVGFPSRDRFDIDIKLWCGLRLGTPPCLQFDIKKC
jgi:hypothetical protein